MGRFIILSGPSCVGKGPLHTAFSNFYPEHAAKLRKLVLYNCRSPRPGEIDGKDYHFRSREEIERLREKDNFIVLDVRGDLQAVDLNDAERTLAAGDLFFEGNPFVGRKLQEAFASKVTVLSIFLAPLSHEEIVFLQSQERSLSLADFLTDVMRRKLLRRTQRQKNILSLRISRTSNDGPRAPIPNSRKRGILSTSSRITMAKIAKTGMRSIIQWATLAKRCWRLQTWWR